ncbi:cystathionine beta-lyase [Azoarcus indigens]|uniref:Cystathionine beta-lyase n=1 Tax=Azoarcus indigens TaxID=29545 RepID=A0A4R6DJT2_9RHOO|nr:cystathionine beta-lyase [Azoarcus indigens]NMG67292.1 cystathionine beta-lyase [Azoarcus indigens]TDN44987.1 cystathionine beta-lyase [Azoarcus indigens]
MSDTPAPSAAALPPGADPALAGYGIDTVALHAGRHPERFHGVVNPPVYHASTFIFETVEQLIDTRHERAGGAFEQFTYGREGTPTTRALEDAVSTLEGGYRAVVTSCGLGAIAASLTAFLSAGDHLLIIDSVYGPARAFCDEFLIRFGVEVTYFDPLIGAGIRELFQPNTKVVYLESPCSLTFEVVDVPAIAAACRERGITTIMDNTWASPLCFRPLDHGVDVSLHAATKYISGHSDLMLGIAVCTEPAFIPVKKTASGSGYCGGPDDVYMALRGLRTLPIRMKRHQETATHVARWLQQRPEVARVMYPALSDDPGHALWKRDFHGASGLFGAVLQPCSPAQLAAMLDHMELFRMGYSWGGYESLVVPTWPATLRTATEWKDPGPALRLHAGLEDPDDLIRDLEKGFARLAAAA